MKKNKHKTPKAKDKPKVSSAFFYPGQTEPSYTGKVRVRSDVGELVSVAEVTNKISAFDIRFTEEIPYKGASLNLTAAYFLKATEDIIPNCLLAVPHPRFSIWRRATVYKVEFIVRGYNAGSFRKHGKKRKKNPWGYALPKALRDNQKLPFLMVTPTTKAPDGEHDLDISREEIIAKGLMTAKEYDYLHKIALRLFRRGQKMAAERGLILVDTKYEFGKLPDGTIVLVDEVHTADSSRYWYRDNYSKTFKAGEEPKQISKEFFRKWLEARGFTGEPGQRKPKLTETIIKQMSDIYVENYGKLTGHVLTPEEMKQWNDDTTAYEKVCATLINERSKLEGADVGVIMGSKSDLPMMQGTINTLTKAGITFRTKVVSAHRTPDQVERFAQEGYEKGMKVIIAAAGGAAHLPGMTASHGGLIPTIGVPIKTKKSIGEGVDALYSIVQMPEGIPVGTMGIDASVNGAIFALQILSSGGSINAKNYLIQHQKNLKEKVNMQNIELKNEGYFVD